MSEEKEKKFLRPCLENVGYGAALAFGAVLGGMIAAKLFTMVWP